MSFPQLNQLFIAHRKSHEVLQSLVSDCVPSLRAFYYRAQPIYLSFFLWSTLPFSLPGFCTCFLCLQCLSTSSSADYHILTLSVSKILLRETFSENCMVGGFFRLLPYHWIPTWHLLQPTTIFIICFLICHLFLQLKCELQECRDFISFGHFWISSTWNNA